ncbi:MAG TPA: hypothetical protein PLK00_13595, partial [Candidatus Hydrogenedentes bacterium]|nr:hypothetical protein [Candidatus Hydrogenedentota bacterium]
MKYDETANGLTQSRQAAKKNHDGQAPVCGGTPARVVSHQRRTGTCSKRRPRRDNVSPFEP